MILITVIKTAHSALESLSRIDAPTSSDGCFMRGSGFSAQRDRNSATRNRNSAEGTDIQ